MKVKLYDYRNGFTNPECETPDATEVSVDSISEQADDGHFTVMASFLWCVGCQDKLMVTDENDEVLYESPFDTIDIRRVESQERRNIIKNRLKEVHDDLVQLLSESNEPNELYDYLETDMPTL